MQIEDNSKYLKREGPTTETEDTKQVLKRSKSQSHHSKRASVFMGCRDSQYRNPWSKQDAIIKREIEDLKQALRKQEAETKQRESDI